MELEVEQGVFVELPREVAAAHALGEAEEGEGFNKIVYANVAKGVTKAKEALAKNGGSVNEDTLDVTYANTQKNSAERNDKNLFIGNRFHVLEDA